MTNRNRALRRATATLAVALGLGLALHAQNVTNDQLLKGLGDPGRHNR